MAIFKPKIHAEIQLVFFYEQYTDLQRTRVICSSKNACFLPDSKIMLLTRKDQDVVELDPSGQSSSELMPMCAEKSQSDSEYSVAVLLLNPWSSWTSELSFYLNLSCDKVMVSVLILSDADVSMGNCWFLRSRDVASYSRTLSKTRISRALGVLIAVSAFLNLDRDLVFL